MLLTHGCVNDASSNSLVRDAAVVVGEAWPETAFSDTESKHGPTHHSVSAALASSTGPVSPVPL